MLAQSSDSFLLMDKKNVSYGSAHSKIELCDVLEGNDTFIHVKHYSTSATLSHLFSQGYNSAYLVNSDPAFVRKANEKIMSQPNGSKYQISTGCIRRVVFAIICEKVNQPPSIPFFSRITYNEASRHLRSMGIECEICAVKKIV